MSERIRLAVLSCSVSRAAGGMFTSVRKLTQQLANQPGCEARVYGFVDVHTAEDIPAWLPLQPTVFPCRGLRFFPVSPAMWRAVLASQPDLIHTHGIWTYPSLVGLAARRRGIPYMVSPRGMLDPWALANVPWKKRLAGWFFENRHLHGAACLHALCASEAASMRAYGLRNPVCVIPNGVDLPGEGVQGSGFGVQEEGSKVLLFMGRIHPKKGLIPLVRAWAKGKNPEWVLAVAGPDENEHLAEVRRCAEEGGVGETIRFIGPHYGLAKDAWLRRADAFILPSFSEGLPMAVLEAWAYGKPVLMTPECNLSEGFTAEAALRIEAESASIASGLRNLMEMNDHQRATMGSKGRALVEERFTWPRIAAQMKAVYDWVLGGGERPACVIMN